MLGIEIKSEETQDSADPCRQQLLVAFPGRDVAEMCRVLRLYDQAYLATREYCAYYYIMGTETIIEYINSKHLGYIWTLLENAIFDCGINSLCGFYGHRTGKNKSEHILEQCKAAFGEDVSSSNHDFIKAIIKYRHNNTAHHGNAFHKISVSFKYETLLKALETLRRDRLIFDKDKAQINVNIYYESLQQYFCEKVDDITSILGEGTITTKDVVSEIKELVDDIVRET